MINSKNSCILLFGAVLLFFSSCNSSFDPLEENDNYFFSMYGYLDASADTQWVRIMPLSETLYPDSAFLDSTNVEVTLHSLETDELVTMQDSVFHFGNDISAWNFSTTHQLQPDHTYLLSATNAEGNSSQTSITMPSEFPTPVVYLGISTIGEIINAVVEIQGVEHLADLQSIYQIYFRSPEEEGCPSEVPSNNTQLFSIPNIDKANRTTNGFVADLSMEEDERYIRSRIGTSANICIYPQQFFIASANEEWLDFSVIDDEIISLPEGISNIENGVGYIVGVYSKTIPFENCTDKNNRPAPCEVETRIN